MHDFDLFTGGVFDTNSYYLPGPGGNILIDAPEGALAWLTARHYRVDLLLLTHGHADHTLDAAKIQCAFGCPVGYHEDGEGMLRDPSFFTRFGFGIEIETLAEGGLHLEEASAQVLAGRTFDLLLVPGHCPGSLCFYDPAKKWLFGGDVLFAGGVGRWDLPGGDRQLLIDGIRQKILPLADDVRVFPGHGPSTTVGQERRSNPYL